MSGIQSPHRPEGDHMFSHILIGVDERPGGRDAIALGRDLLAEGGELTLAHVHLGEAKPTRGASPAFEAAQRERSRQLLEAARAEAGVDAQFASVGRPSPKACSRSRTGSTGCSTRPRTWSASQR